MADDKPERSGRDSTHPTESALDKALDRALGKAAWAERRQPKGGK